MTTPAQTLHLCELRTSLFQTHGRLTEHSKFENLRSTTEETNNTMDDPRDEHRMSLFFTLPRELRDTIYGYLLDLEIRLDPITLPDKKGWLNINGHLRRSVCLVNRQIYHEYLKQLPSHMNLTMDLWYGNIAGFEKVLHNPNFRRLLSRLRHLAVIYRDQYDQVARRSKYTHCIGREGLAG